MTTSSTDKGAAVRFPPPLIFLGLLLVGYLFERFVFSVGPALEGHGVGLGWSLVVLAIVLLKLSLQRFKDTEQNPKPWKASPTLIIEGIYCYTRNPMYVGMALLQVGIGFNLGNLYMLLLAPVSLVLVFFVAVRPEEAYLETQFGADYVAYKARVKRWL